MAASVAAIPVQRWLAFATKKAEGKGKEGKGVTHQARREGVGVGAGTFRRGPVVSQDAQSTPGLFFKRR